MWATLIGLIERWWREKSRLDTVRAIVKLRDAMQNCDKRYQTYVAAKKSRASGHLSIQKQSLEEWRESISELGERVKQLAEVFEIFDPKVHRSIFAYHGDEIQYLAKDVLYAVAEQLKEEPEIDIYSVAISDKYREALHDLDVFIRSTFKPEELLAAKRSRLR
jgi:hypothetical protein